MSNIIYIIRSVSRFISFILLVFCFFISSAAVAGAVDALPKTMPKGTIGKPYSVQFYGQGGTAPYKITRQSGDFPPGVTMDASGLAAGVPTSSGIYNVVVQVVDANNVSDYARVIIDIGTVSISITPKDVPVAYLGKAYSVQYKANGGTAPYTLELVGGALPPGLAFSSGGLMSGTPSKKGDYPLTVRATDKFGLVDQASMTLHVVDTPVTALPENAPSASLGKPYSLQFFAKGGKGPYKLALKSGKLPKGLTFSGSGLVSGTPTVSGSFPLTVRVDDALGAHDETTVTIAVTAGGLALLPKSAPAGLLGQIYTLQLQASGGSGPYQYELVAGSLPPGLHFSGNGVVSGTPTRKGTYTFTATTTDKSGQKASVRLSIAVSEGIPEDVTALIDSVDRTAEDLGDNQINAIFDRMAMLHQLDCLPSSLSVNAGGVSFNKANDEAQTCSEETAVWFSGTYSAGERDGSGNHLDTSFGSGGLTAGIDHRLSENVIVGASVGMGFGSADIGDRGTHEEGRALSLAAYGSVELFRSTFLDSVIGYNHLNFDMRRFVSGDTFARADRGGDQFFAATSLSHVIELDDLTITPYGRLKLISTRWNDAAEHGAGAFDLTYLSSHVSTLTGSLGARVETTVETEMGELKPYLDVEYQRTFSESGRQKIFFSNAPATVFSRNSDPLSDNMFSGEIGAQMNVNSNTSLTLSYRAGSDFDDLFTHTVFGQLSIRF